MVLPFLLGWGGAAERTWPRHSPSGSHHMETDRAVSLDPPSSFPTRPLASPFPHVLSASVQHVVLDLPFQQENPTTFA